MLFLLTELDGKRAEIEALNAEHAVELTTPKSLTEQPKADTSIIDPIIAAAEKIGLEQCDPQSIARWMITTNSDLVVKQNTLKDLKAQIEAVKAQGKPPHMNQLYKRSAPKDPAA